MTDRVHSPRAAGAALREYDARRHLPYPFLLEHAFDAPGAEASSLVGADPFAVVRSRGPVVEIRDGEGVRRVEGDPLAVLQDELDRAARSSHHPERIVAVGFLGYDLARQIEKLPEAAADDQSFPESHFALYDDHLRLDGEGSRERITDGVKRARAGSFEGAIGSTAAHRVETGTNFTRGDYERAVERVREHIAAGDVYQANLSQRFAVRGAPGPRDLYARLRAESPAPYAALLELGERGLISSSPELFLRVRGRQVETMPIKGTRPRGRDDADDRRLARELVESEKDAAELVMIVDLERNDLGRVAVPGTVKVRERARLEAHPTVWHLAATVEATLPPTCTSADLLRATFPGGSITGAPKIRAMEIIESLEPTRRSVFTGAIGWIGATGDMTLNVGIRTIQTDGDLATFQVGGAIVWDSSPAGEYEETLVKARAMARALGLEEG